MASIAVVDTPGFQSPRQQRSERAATFEELCHNYVQERLQGLFYEKTFLWQMERYREVRSRGWEQLPAPGSGAAFVPRGPAVVWVNNSWVLLGGSAQSSEA